MPGWIIVYSLLLMFVLKTVHRNSEWQTKERLARSGLKVNPTNAKIHVTLGNVLANKVCINRKIGKLHSPPSRQTAEGKKTKRAHKHRVLLIPLQFSYEAIPLFDCRCF